jgi:HEAT repeat protein
MEASVTTSTCILYCCLALQVTVDRPRNGTSPRGGEPARAIATIDGLAIDDWRVRFTASSSRERAEWFARLALREITLAASDSDAFAPLLADPDADVRRFGCETMRRASELGEASKAALLERIGDAADAVRVAAAQVLLERCDSPDQAIATLLDGQRLPDPGIRREVVRSIRALHVLDPSVRDSALMVASRDDDGGVRLEAVQGLRDSPEAPERLQRLHELLSDGDARVRTCAFATLIDDGCAVPALVRELIARLRDLDAGTRRNAILALDEISASYASEAIKDVSALLADDDAAVLCAAIRFIARFAALASDALPAVLRLSGNADHAVRSASLPTLARIGGRNECVVTTLIERSRDVDAGVRASAMEGLRIEIQDFGMPGVALRELLFASDAFVRARVLQLVAEYAAAPSTCADEFATLLDDPDPSVRTWACWANARCGDAASLAVPQLTSLLSEDPFEAVRIEAARTLGALGPAAAASVSVLLAALKDPSPQVRYAAIGVLPQIGVKTDAVFDALARIRVEGSREEQIGAVAALRTLGEPVATELSLKNADATEFELLTRFRCSADTILLADSSFVIAIEFDAAENQPGDSTKKRSLDFRYRIYSRADGADHTGSGRAVSATSIALGSRALSDQIYYRRRIRLGSIDFTWTDEGNGNASIRWQPNRMTVSIVARAPLELLPLSTFAKWRRP